MRALFLALLAAAFESALAGVAKRDLFEEGQPIDLVAGKGAPISGNHCPVLAGKHPK